MDGTLNISSRVDLSSVSNKGFIRKKGKQGAGNKNVRLVQKWKIQLSR